MFNYRPSTLLWTALFSGGFCLPCATFWRYLAFFLFLDDYRATFFVIRLFFFLSATLLFFPTKFLLPFFHMGRNCWSVLRIVHGVGNAPCLSVYLREPQPESACFCVILFVWMSIVWENSSSRTHLLDTCIILL
jgi:hypothetical protein